MTDNARLIARIALVFVILAGASTCARAQYAWGYTGVYYDSEQDRIVGYGVTWIDYKSQYYYDPMVHVTLSGSDRFFDSFRCAPATPCKYGNYAWAVIVGDVTPGAVYNATAQHYIDIYYKYNDPACKSGCYKAYDAFGYGLIGR